MIKMENLIRNTIIGFVIIVILLLTRIVYRIYRAFTIDITEMINYEKKYNKQTIFAFYGHTSMWDGIYLGSVGVKFGNIKALAKKKYKWMYPTILKKKLVFIDENSKNTTKSTFDHHFCILIEGTRKKMNHVKMGYKYIAQQNDCNIVYMLMNVKHNKIEISEPFSHTLSKEEMIDKLKEFIKDKDLNDYSINPKYISDIALKKK